VKLRKDFEYALISLLAMADTGLVFSSRELSERFNIPLNLLRRILHQLNRGQMVEAVRGPKGGFRLRRPLKELTSLTVEQFGRFQNDGSGGRSRGMREFRPAEKGAAG
jgi:Rrf2 family protein